MIRALLLGAAALGLTACGGPAEEQAATDAPVAVPSASGEAAVAPAAAAQSAATASIALDDEGLRLVDPATGSTRLLAFETPAGPVLAALERVQGRVPERSSNGECGAGPLDFAAWPDRLSVVLQGDQFVGWSVRDDAPAGQLTTMSGVGVGSTRASLEAAYDATVEESTLGTEFRAGGISGLLSSARPDARITTLWAGTDCSFR